MKKIKSCLIAIFIVIGVIFINTSAMANSPSEPYNLILKAISNHDIDRAYHWIKVTQEDFPDNKEAELARWLLIPLRMAEIDSELEVKMAYLRGANTGLLGNAGLFANLMSTGIDSWIAAEYLNNVLVNYSNDKTYDFNLIVPEPFDYDRYELEMISRGQRSPNYESPSSIAENISKNLLREWMLTLKALESGDNMERARLFYGISSRLYIGLIEIKTDESTSKVLKEEKPIIKEALNKCIEIALNLTEDNRYTDLRVDIEELKEKVDIEELKDRISKKK